MGLRGSRHQRTKSMSWVASITAGDRWTRPPILLPSEQAVARERIMGLLGRGGHDDGIDVRTAQEFAIVDRGATGARLLGHLLEPVTVNLAEVQALDQGMSGTPPGPEPANPAHADDAHVDRAAHPEASTGWPATSTVLLISRLVIVGSRPGRIVAGVMRVLRDARRLYRAASRAVNQRPRSTTWEPSLLVARSKPAALPISESAMQVPSFLSLSGNGLGGVSGSCTGF